MRVYGLEKKAVELAADKAGLSTSDYMRKACLGKTITQNLTEEELKLYKLLVDFRNNFARISNLVKAKKDFTSPLKDLIQALDQQLNKFKT